MVLAEEQVQRVEYVLRGAAKELFLCRPWEYKEILFEGVAGGGKSLAIALLIHDACLRYPGLQVLMVRKYRDSMSDSCMKTFEEEVLKADGESAAICASRDRTQRHSYQYPNGSNVVTCGITEEEKIRSTAWHIIWLNEGTQVTVASYETLLTRLRPQAELVNADSAAIPYSLLVSDCNPSYEAHFLNTRFKTLTVPTPDPRVVLKRKRLVSSHKDNPTYWNAEKGEWTPKGAEYMGSLSSTTGTRRKRLYLGIWCTEEGQVYDEFDPSFHVLTRKDLPEMEYYFMSADWGYRNAGVLQCWGVDKHERMYLVHETYRTMETIDFWADEAVKLYNEFRPIACVCDPAEPDKRRQFNERLSRFRGGAVSRIAIEANNDREAGMMEVKSALQRERHLPSCNSSCEKTEPHGKARLYFAEDSLRWGRDPKIDVDSGRPVCTTDEIQSLVWKKTADGRPIKEEWEDSLPHDGCDAMRYAAMFNWKRRAPQRGKKQNPFAPGTVGHDLWRRGIKLAQMN